MPPDAYFDHPVDKLEPQENDPRSLSYGFARDGLNHVFEWITRGRGGITRWALRLDIVLLCLWPQFLPCPHPTAAWIARRHGVSRQRTNDLRKEFARYLAPHIQFRGQRFLNRASAPQKTGREWQEGGGA
jgi:hypothetical protein